MGNLFGRTCIPLRVLSVIASRGILQKFDNELFQVFFSRNFPKKSGVSSAISPADPPWSLCFIFSSFANFFLPSILEDRFAAGIFPGFTFWRGLLQEFYPIFPRIFFSEFSSGSIFFRISIGNSVQFSISPDVLSRIFSGVSYKIALEVPFEIPWKVPSRNPRGNPARNLPASIISPRFLLEKSSEYASEDF